MTINKNVKKALILSVYTQDVDGVKIALNKLLGMETGNISLSAIRPVYVISDGVMVARPRQKRQGRFESYSFNQKENLLKAFYMKKRSRKKIKVIIEVKLYGKCTAIQALAPIGESPMAK